MRMSSLRILLPVVFVLICFHYLLAYSSDTYSSTTSSLSLSRWTSSVDDLSTEELLDVLAERASAANLSLQAPIFRPTVPKPRANAVIVMLARNSELNDVASSMRQLEDRFNSKYNYPWVFLNDEPFSEEFIR